MGAAVGSLEPAQERQHNILSASIIRKFDRLTVEIAESRNIPLLTTALPMFESCGRLWVHGLPGCSEYEKKH